MVNLTKATHSQCKLAKDSTGLTRKRGGTEEGGAEGEEGGSRKRRKNGFHLSCPRMHARVGPKGQNRHMHHVASSDRTRSRSLFLGVEETHISKQIKDASS